MKYVDERDTILTWKTEMAEESKAQASRDISTNNSAVFKIFMR